MSKFQLIKILFPVGFLLSALFITGNIADDSSDPKRVIIFGDSITAGYGLDSDQAFPALLQRKADNLDLNIEVINAGVSGETSAGGLRRIDWVLQREIDVFVLELGGNDGLRGIDPEVTRENLQQIMDKVWGSNPETRIILAGMEAPPNMGDSYTTRFRQIFTELAESNDVVFMPFILEDVGGIPELNQSDGIHPTGEGHQIIADNLWEYLSPVLDEFASDY
jgi:acyl-CoA thioesterase I